MKIKIFFILSFSPKYEFLKDNSTGDANKVWYNKKGELIGVWDGDWAHIIGNRILKINKDIEYTVLRTDIRADKIYEYKFETGLEHISFPSRKVIEHFGIKYTLTEYSDELILYLYKIFQKPEKFIIILPITQSKFFITIMKKFSDKVPIINPHFVSNSILIPEINNFRNPLRFVHRYFIKIQKENLLNKLKNVTFYQKTHKKQIEEKYKFNSILFSIGFNPNEWKKNMNKEKAREKLGVKQNTKVILLSSRYVPEKQVDKVIEVLSKFRNEDYQCFITGRGDTAYIDYLQKLISKLELKDNIKLTGYLSREDLAMHYIASDVFFMSSIKEGGPGSTSIAVWHEIPVISTDTGYISEILKENNAGIIVKTNDYEEWENAFKKFFKGEFIKLLNKSILLENDGAEENINRLIGFIQKVYNNFYKI